MGFWNTLFGGESDPAEAQREADARNFDLLKYDGVKAMRMGQTDYAVKCFEKALTLRDDAETRDYLSQALVRQGDYAGAMAQLSALIEQEPQNIGLMVQAASVAYIAEDYQEMTSLCERALTQEGGDSAIVNLVYAKAWAAQGEPVQAVARLTRAIALDDSLAEAHLLRGQSLLAMGDVAGAAEDAQWLLSQDTPDEDAFLLAARIEAARGNGSEAEKLFGQVIELNPFAIDAYRGRGQLRYERGDKSGAEEDMQKVMELDPQSIADVSGEYSAEGIEQKTRQAYSALNPFGI